jgi:hypothetical protein
VRQDTPVPTLPLFDPAPAKPFRPHAIRAPGGYETWRFAAHDPANQIWITANFDRGFACREYIRRYLRYRRWPTRFPPPLPKDYLGIRGWIRLRDWQTSWSAQIDPAMFVDLDDGGIEMGPNRFFHSVAGGMNVRSSGINLVFNPRHPQEPLESNTTPAYPEKGETHRWIIPDGLCDVTGTIQIGETKLAFAGTGVRDQQYGTSPRLRGSFGGYLIVKDKALIFQTTDPTHVVTTDATSLKIESEAAPRTHRHRSMWGLSYPHELKLKGEALLWNPKIIQSNPSSARVEYDADWQGERAVAMCEVAAPHRIGWPIVGSLIELAANRTR